jgi:hypothetical protein
MRKWFLFQLYNAMGYKSLLIKKKMPMGIQFSVENRLRMLETLGSIPSTKTND